MVHSWKQTSHMMNANNNLVCQVFQSLEEDVCSTDIARNPFIPFRGRSVLKCDKSKFNHKEKVSSISRSHLQYSVFSIDLNYTRHYFLLILKSDRGGGERPRVGDKTPSRPCEAFSAIVHYVSRTTVLNRGAIHRHNKHRK